MTENINSNPADKNNAADVGKVATKADETQAEETTRNENPDATKNQARQSRKLAGTRVELPKSFVANLLKKQAASQKRSHKKIPIALLIVSGHTPEKTDAFIKHEEALLAPWKEKGSTGGA
jgi:hypothetical protein